jgi:hypothetical protein
MHRDQAGLALTAGLTGAVTAVLLAVELTGASGPLPTALRLVAGLPLVLVLPGRALSVLLGLAGRAQAGPVSPVLWHGMWAAGLSLAASVLGGLALNLSPAGLTGPSWTIALGGLTLAACAGAAARGAARRPHTALAACPAGATQPGGGWRRRRPGGRSRAVAATGWALATLLVAGAAAGLAASGASGQPGPGFAQLWLVPARAGTGSQATVGVRSGYRQAERFCLVLQRGGRALASRQLTLSPGETWRTGLSGSPGELLAARLTVPGRPGRPLRVSLRLPAASQPAASSPQPRRGHR